MSSKFLCTLCGNFSLLKKLSKLFASVFTEFTDFFIQGVPLKGKLYCGSNSKCFLELFLFDKDIFTNLTNTVQITAGECDRNTVPSSAWTRYVYLFGLRFWQACHTSGLQTLRSHRVSLVFAQPVVVRVYLKKKYEARQEHMPKSKHVLSRMQLKFFPCFGYSIQHKAGTSSLWAVCYSQYELPNGHNGGQGHLLLLEWVRYVCGYN